MRLASKLTAPCVLALGVGACSSTTPGAGTASGAGPSTGAVATTGASAGTTAVTGGASGASGASGAGAGSSAGAMPSTGGASGASGAIASGTGSGGTSSGSAASSGVTTPNDGGTSGAASGSSTGTGPSGSTDAATDAGEGGAGSGGDAAAGGAPGCAGKTYKLCEDFESGLVGGVPTGWTTLRGYAAQRGGIGLATDESHSGRMSLKSDSMSTGMDRVQKSLTGLGATVTKHWGRLFYKVGTPPPQPNTGVIHITFTALEGTTENRVVDTVVATNGTHQWLFNIPDDSCCTGSSYNWRFDSAWHCAEWSIDVAAESFRFFSDGQEVTQLAFTGRPGAKMSTYTSIALGTIFYQVPPGPVVVWFDDLAIDDTQVGCGP